ncbi:hypothetical protein AB0K00_25415 [Dactylosporangium sp. NPDC049525]|uniref:hypothetical protein n=1 Tax=Dactylosporangium sp. NPDC049525 TaxID=3154730 RepID=UPI003428EDCA
MARWPARSRSRWPTIRLRVIPVRLDDTPLPPLLRSIIWVDGEAEGAVTVARKIMGLDTGTLLRISGNDRQAGELQRPGEPGIEN